MDESPVKPKSDRVLGWVVLPVVAVILMFAPLPDWAINGFYSDSVYPQLQRVVTSGTNFLPFAILDVLIVAALLLTLFTILRSASEGVERRLRGRDLGRQPPTASRRRDHRHPVPGRLGLQLSPASARAAISGWRVRPRRRSRSLQAAVLDANALAAKLRRDDRPEHGSAIRRGRRRARCADARRA